MSGDLDGDLDSHLACSVLAKHTPPFRLLASDRPRGVVVVTTGRRSVRGNLPVAAAAVRCRRLSRLGSGLGTSPARARATRPGPAAASESRSRCQRAWG